MDFMPFIAGITYSVAHSFFTNAMYPLPIFIVQEHQLTTAYSLFDVQYSLAFAPWLISLRTSGFIIDYLGFLLLQIYFIVLEKRLTFERSPTVCDLCFSTNSYHSRLHTISKIVA